MTTFYLLRHGAKENLEGDPPLSQVGIKQAEITAKYLAHKKIHTVYVSPMKRTRQTAEIINRILKLPIFTDDRLKERMNWGDIKGQSFDQFMEEWTKADKDRYYEPIPGNSSVKTGQNMKYVLDEVAESYPNKNILVLTHGGAIYDFLRNVFPGDKLPLIVNQSENIQYMEISECSITIVNSHHNDYSLESVGSFHHLPVMLQ